MSYYIGIDGGGSGMRVVIIDAARTVITRIETDSANPSSLGLDESTRRIQAAMTQALQQANLAAEAIAAAGIGIAGAAEAHSRPWLTHTAQAILPAATIIPSSDVEVALVGAHGARSGGLLIAGTGSIIAGFDRQHQLVRLGGWGYIFGDEGSGFWIGNQALMAATRAYDQVGPPTILLDRIMAHRQITNPYDLIQWVYRGPKVPVREIAALVPLVLQAAKEDDTLAQQIVEVAARELAHLAQTLMKRTGLTAADLKFAGSLITNDNDISQRLCERLSLAAIPQAQYEPVMGAALLALYTDQPGSEHAN